MVTVTTGDGANTADRTSSLAAPFRCVVIAVSAADQGVVVLGVVVGVVVGVVDVVGGDVDGAGFDGVGLAGAGACAFGARAWVGGGAGAP
jgi:hypothetical protein